MSSTDNSRSQQRSIDSFLVDAWWMLRVAAGIIMRFRIRNDNYTLESANRWLDRYDDVMRKLYAQTFTDKTSATLNNTYATNGQEVSLMFPVEVYWRILYERYINNKPWNDIADNLSYSLSSVYRAHKEALVYIAKCYGIKDINDGAGLKKIMENYKEYCCKRI
jgi:hypothetical protein